MGITGLNNGRGIIMKRLLLIIFTLTCIYANGHELSGVWYAGTPHPLARKIIKQFSWGPVEFIYNFERCIGIDLEGESPIFCISGEGDYKIKNVIKADDGTYKLDFFFARGNFIAQCVIHLSNNEFWIAPIEGLDIFPTGEDEVYYNLSRPSIKATHKTIDNLRLRSNSDISASIITTLEKGTEVEMLESGKIETIDRITASWVRVRSSTGYTGWCFSGYLEKMQE
jgi:hypothetical protein